MNNGSFDSFDRNWILGSVIIALALAAVSALGSSATGGIRVADPESWINAGGPVVQLMYALVGLSVVAAMVERVLEVCVSALRRPVREVLEIEASHAKSFIDKKSEDSVKALLKANLAVQEYRAKTRVRTLSVGIVLGAAASVVIDFQLFQLIVGEASPLLRYVETLVVGLLVAGGSEPIHAIIGGMKKSFGNLAGARRVLR